MLLGKFSCVHQGNASNSPKLGRAERRTNIRATGSSRNSPKRRIRRERVMVRNFMRRKVEVTSVPTVVLHGRGPKTRSSLARAVGHACRYPLGANRHALRGLHDDDGAFTNYAACALGTR